MSIIGAICAILVVRIVWLNDGQIEYLGAAIIVVAIFSSARVCLVNYLDLVRFAAMESELEGLRLEMAFGEVSEDNVRDRYRKVFQMADPEDYHNNLINASGTTD